MEQHGRVEAGEAWSAWNHTDKIDSMEAGSEGGEYSEVITHFISVLEIIFFEWVLIGSVVPWLNPMPSA
jgi:hypothetical protein